MPLYRMVWMALPIVCSACASGILVERLDADNPSSAPIGVPWNLPMTQFNLTITRQLTDCKLGQSPDGKPTGLLLGSVTVTGAASKAPDRDQQYVLSSSGWWATSDILSQLGADGVSTGLTAHSEDATAGLINSLLTFGTQVALAGVNYGARGPLGSVALAPGAVLAFECSDAARAALQAVAGLKKTVEDDNTAVTDANAQVTQLMAPAQAGSADKAALAAATSDFMAKQKKLTNDQAGLAKTLKGITDVQNIVWPTNASITRVDRKYHLSAEVADKWGVWKNLPAGMPIPLVNSDTFDVSLALYVLNKSGDWGGPAQPAQPNITQGVPVRIARPGRILMCTGATPCPTSLTAGWMPNDLQVLAVSPDVSILQLGQIYTVPMTGGTFKSEGTTIAMDANGNPTSIEIYEKTAVVGAAAGAASSAMTQIAGVPTQVAQAQLAATQAQTSQITAANQLVLAKANAGTAVATAAAQAQGALATAQANLATAQANALAAGPQGQLALINVQNNIATAIATASDQPKVAALGAVTTLVNSQATLINAEITLAKAKAALAALP